MYNVWDADRPVQERAIRAQVGDVDRPLPTSAAGIMAGNAA